jgi:integrase
VDWRATRVRSDRARTATRVASNRSPRRRRHSTSRPVELWPSSSLFRGHKPERARSLWRSARRFTSGQRETLCGALRLAPLVFVRPGELRKAEWKDIDLDAAEWRYIVTKTNTPHIVPLSRQAIEILRELQPLTGKGRFVFPGARTIKRPMSDNAILAAMRRMGIGKEEMSGHGFRAVARTILDEVLGVRPDLIEHRMAHAVRDPNGRAYNRTAHLPERRKMMQQWADYLDKLKAGAKVISINQRA